MPIHDWSRVNPGKFHEFHLEWLVTIKQVLNQKLLPPAFYVSVEQREKPRESKKQFVPDLLALELMGGSPPGAVSTAVLESPRLEPVARLERDVDFYRRRQRRLSVRAVDDDQLVAIVELVSRGNKSNVRDFRIFVEKVQAYLERDIHVMIIDLQLPTRRDPNGMHGAIRRVIDSSEYQMPPDRPFTFASYEAGEQLGLYVQHAAVGEPCPTMPLFLKPGLCVHVPLEETYLTTWERQSAAFRYKIESAMMQ